VMHLPYFVAWFSSLLRIYGASWAVRVDELR
jgi:hypothetical protein